MLACIAWSALPSLAQIERRVFAVRLEGKWSTHRGDLPGGPAAGADPKLDVSRWERVSLPEKGAPGAERTTWYRTEFHWGQRHSPPAFLVLGRVEGEDAVYLNGLAVGGTAGAAARGASGRRARVQRFEAPWIQPGRNVIAVRVDGLDGGAGRIVGGPLRLASGEEARRLLGPGRMEPTLAPAANFGLAAQADARGRLLARVVAESATKGPIEVGWGSVSVADRDTGLELALEEFEKNEVDIRWPIVSFRAVDRRFGDLRVEGEMFAPLAWREEWICALPLALIDLRLENGGALSREIEVVLRFHERSDIEVTELAGFDEISSRLGYTGAKLGPLAIALDGAVEPEMPMPGHLRLVSSTVVPPREVRRIRAAVAFREDERRWSDADPGVERAIDLAWSQWQRLRDQTVAFDRGLPSTGDAELDAALRAYASFATRRTAYEREGEAFIRTETRDPGAAAEEAFYVSSAHLVLWPNVEELMVVSWAKRILAELPSDQPPAHLLPHLWFAARAIRLARWKGGATRVTPDIARAFKRTVAAILRADRDANGLPEAGEGEDPGMVAALALHVLEATTQASSSLRLDESEAAVVSSRLARARETARARVLPDDPRALRRVAYAWIFPSSATLDIVARALPALDAQATPCGIAQRLSGAEGGAETEPGLDYLDALGRARLGLHAQALELARRALRADLGPDLRRPPSRYLVGCEALAGGRAGARNAALLSYLTEGLLGWGRRDAAVEIAPWIDPELADLESNTVVPEGYIVWRRKARAGGWTLGFESVLLYPLECDFLIRLAPDEGAPLLRAAPVGPTKGDAPPSAAPPQRLEIVERRGGRFARLTVRLETGHGARFEVERSRGVDPGR
jgi:hypothetical protein